MTEVHPLRVFSDALEAVGEARTYGYETSASFAAALDLLRCVDEGDARVIAAMLAALIAMDLRPRTGEELQVWADQWSEAIAAPQAAT